MTDEDPAFLYRGTTLSRVEDHWSGNSDFPGNWTDDPLQGASYALGYALGDSHNNVPVVIATEYEESFFEGSGNAIPHYFPNFDVGDDRSPEWYSHESEDRFDTEHERDQAFEMFDLNDLETFISEHLSEASEHQRNTVRDSFNKLTSFERYEEVR